MGSKDALKRVKCFLSDLDGTIWLGGNLIEGADEFLALLRQQGKEYIFFTNNSSKKQALLSG
jgi:ribonucleotide monophosphatase NagD (HAD superfamily)